MFSFPLLGRTLSWAALTSLISLALCASPAAQAQGTQTDTYTVTYSGGATTAIGSTDFPAGPYTLASAPDQHVPSGNAYGGSASNHQIFSGNSVTVNCQGAVTATFTWNGGPNNDPAPVAGSVIVVEQVNASCNGQSGSVSSDLPGGTSSGSSAGSQTYTATRYSVKGGGSFTATCTPTASASSTAPPGGYSGVSVGVGYTASASPVTLTPAGTTLDSSHNYDILVGQYCSASLSGLPIPSGATVSYQWSVSGTTFQTWSADTPPVGGNPYNSDASYYVDGPGPLTNSTAGWYWNDRSQTPTSETVSCTATVTPPAGQGSPFTVSLTKNVLVYRPSWTATGVGGYVAIRLGSGTTYEIVATSTATQLASGLKGGMNFTATVTSPDTSLFGDGNIQLAQLCTPGRSFTSANGDYTYSQNGQEGLDGTYPYGWNVGAPLYQTDDLPGSTLQDYSVANFTMQDQFKDFIMYYPPGSVQCVPLAQFIWSTNGYAVLPHTGLWSSYVTQNGSDNAGTVSPSGNTATFLLSNVFPEWTQITGTGTFGFTSPIEGETFGRSSLSTTKRGYKSSATRRSISHQKTIMNKRINEKASSISLFKIEDAQDQYPIGIAHFGRRSGPAPGQQAKNKKCYALDMAGFEALRTGQYSDAETYARQVLTLTHGYDPLAPELLASALDAQDKTAEALQAYKVLANQGGDFPRIMLPYARLLLQSGQWAQAVVAYNKALPELGNLIQAYSHFSPDVPQPRELVVALHVAQGLICGVATWDGHSRHEEAMNEFAQALRLAPDSPLANYYYGYGWQHLDLNSRTRTANAQRAKAAFQKAAMLGDADVKRAATEELKGLK